MFHFGRIPPAVIIRLTLLLGVFTSFSTRAEIIYDNTSTYLNRTFNEKTEYGDQVDLGGTARRLTQILFEYYGDFQQQGDEMVKVRLYTNETPYDRYRKAPTTLLYESGWMPIEPGYNTRSAGGLNIQLPLHTVTVTVEFAGLAENEVAGLLFYGPPTVGYSFNEIWMRGAAGHWAAVNYSSSDPTKRASAGLRLVAEPDVRLDQHQVSAWEEIPLLEGTNRFRIAQTFTPELTGRLSDLTVQMRFTNGPVRVRILDTVGQVPGPNVLGEINLVNGTGEKQRLPFIDEYVFLKAGTNYAIEFSTSVPASGTPTHLVPVSPDPYRRGDLWRRNEAGGQWVAVTENNDGATPLDTVFETYVIPAVPDVEIRAPRPGQGFDATEPIELRALHRPVEIGSIAHVRFMDGTQEIGRVTNAPYVLVWTNALPGEHNLRAIAEDTFRRPFRSEIVPVTVNPPGPPENDLFARRILLTGTVARSIKPTAEATVEPGDPFESMSLPAATIWWAWTAHDHSPVTISAQNSSDPEVRLAVFTGNAISNLVLVTNQLTELRFRPEPGVTYSIVAAPIVRGGQVVLDLAVADVRVQRMIPNVPRAIAPVEFEITGSAGRNVTNVALVAGAQVLSTVGSAPARLSHSFSTNGIFSLQVAATDDRGIETISAPIQVVVHPENDSFRHAKVLSGASGTVSFSSFTATAELIDPVWWGEESHSVWYQWRAPSAGFFALETQARGGEASFGVYTARTNGALVLLDEVAAIEPGESSARLAFQSVPGRLYYFFAAAAGPEVSAFNFEFRPFEIGKVTIQNGAVTLRFAAAPNQRLFVETSVDLRNWVRVGEVIVASGSEVTWTDPTAAGGIPVREKNRFYRVVQE